MFKTVNFNIYEENLEDVVYGEKNTREKKAEKKVEPDEPIPKPPPRFWTDPLSYRRFSRESEGTTNVL
ncbi:hypothetical protein BH20ACI4_BH20ACI4_21600 [soil metagenome]